MGHPLRKNSPQMPFIEWNHPIETIAPCGSDDALHIRVLPRRSQCRSNGLGVHRVHGGRHMRKDRIAIMRTHTMKIYAFDVDDTLEVSGGPISIVSVGSLKPQGHIVGLNGNWAVVVQTVPLWHRIFSFVGPMEMSKDTFLNQLKAHIPADDYIMVGNIKGVSGASDDQGAANLAGWRFIKESDFAAGAR
jgi:hypothetical protein